MNRNRFGHLILQALCNYYDTDKFLLWNSRLLSINY
jgi:hypothetical protein